MDTPERRSYSSYLASTCVRRAIDISWIRMNDVSVGTLESGSRFPEESAAGLFCMDYRWHQSSRNLRLLMQFLMLRVSNECQGTGEKGKCLDG